MKTGGRRFEKVTYTIVIIALLLLPTLPIVLAYNSGLEVTDGSSDDDGSGGGSIYIVCDFTTEYNIFTINFEALCEYQTNARPVEYFWDFGDGSKGKGKNVSHDYLPDPWWNEFNVTLTVYDSTGEKHIISKSVSWDFTPWFVAIGISTALLILIYIYLRRRRK